MRVRIPVPQKGGKMRITEDQRNLLIILEDATLRFIRDEVGLLLSLHEVKECGLAKVALKECLDFIDRRVRQIRRGWPHDRAEEYERTLLAAVDECDYERHILRNDIRTALVQKVQCQHIQRAEYIAVTGGLADSAAKIHELLTGKVHYYDGMFERLGFVDERIGCFLLNEGKLPDMGEAKNQFGRLYDKLCNAVLDLFTQPKEQA